MKISIITATYNSGSTLRDTIESVLNQTYKDIEYIVVDGVSKDNTLEIAHEYEPRFEGKMRIISEPDKGIYDAMNKGIAAATGDVVGILNSDDFYIDNDVLLDISETMSAEDVDSVCGNLYFVDSVETSKIVREWIGSPYRSFTKGWHPAHPTFYARKSLFEDFGSFDISFEISADFELMLRLIEKHKISIKYMDRYFINMRVGGASTGGIKNIIKGNQGVVRAFKKNDIPVSVFYPIKRITTKIFDVIKFKFSKR